MAYTQKTWKDRVSEKPNRRTLTIETQDTNAIVCTVERSEGDVSQEGDAFSADNMNDLEERIKSGLDEKLDGTKLEADTDAILAKTSADGAAPDCYAIKQLYDQLKKFVVDGKQALADAINAQGITTASGDMTFEQLAAAITSTGSGRYSNGYTAGVDKGKQDGSASGYQTGYNEGYAAGKNDGISYADGRANSDSANYKAGYNQGMTDADARTNTDSANYKAGYSAGAASGKSAVSGSVSVSCSGDSGWHDDGNGVHARGRGSASATASINNGVLSVSVSGSFTGEGERWIGDSWQNYQSATGSGSNSARKNL